MGIRETERARLPRPNSKPHPWTLANTCLPTQDNGCHFFRKNRRIHRPPSDDELPPRTVGQDPTRDLLPHGPRSSRICSRNGKHSMSCIGNDPPGQHSHTRRCGSCKELAALNRTGADRRRGPLGVHACPGHPSPPSAHPLRGWMFGIRLPDDWPFQHLLRVHTTDGRSQEGKRTSWPAKAVRELRMNRKSDMSVF